MVRPNSVIAIGGVDDRPDYDYADGVTLHIYELENGFQSTTVIPTLTGDVAGTIEILREGQTVSVVAQGDLKRWQLVLVGAEATASIEGGTAEQTSQGMRITPTNAADRLAIRL
jgi:alpha-D-xyloside xylohydrolase